VLLVPLALLSILAACGGSGKHAGPERIVAGPGYTFAAPAGWRLSRARASISASGDDAAVSVAVFALRKPYVPAQFDRAVAELDGVAEQLVSGSHGKLTESATITLSGRKARAYRYTTSAYRARVAFLLAGRREYELFCRDAESPACTQLFASFMLR